MNPAKVSYISKNTVLPLSPSETIDPINLTPWDLLNLPFHYIQMGLLFPKPHVQEEESTVMDSLKTSLSRTLDYFLPLTCRLATKRHEDDVVSFYIDGKVVGALFIRAIANVTVADVVDPVYVPPVVRSFFPLNGVSNYEGHTQPLLAVQVTELVDGIFIGCSINHIVGDGKSFWHFINSWSAISRSLDHIPRLPDFKRWFLNQTDCPVRFPSSVEHLLLPKNPSSVEHLLLPKNPPSDLLVRVLHFTPEKLAEIKLKANKERETDQISTFQALVGYIWMTMTQAKCLDSSQVVNCSIITDNRTRLDPPLPEAYFGNAISGVIATSKAGELVEKGLGWAAWLLNQVIRTSTDNMIRTFWKNWMIKPFLVFPKHAPPNLVWMGSSPRFDMYGNDFGWGRPIAVRSGPAKMLGETIMVHPGAAEGSLDVEVYLVPQALKAMEDTIEFCKDEPVFIPSP